jgi:hypothetical protein
MIQVIRKVLTDKVTIGELYIDGVLLCYTLEDRDRFLELNHSAKVKSQTAIPTGDYRVVISMSNRFKKLLPEILNVEGFLGIRIHSGNTEKDTEGCILVGMNTDNKTKIYNCAPALNKIIDYIKSNKNVRISITRNASFHPLTEVS